MCKRYDLTNRYPKSYHRYPKSYLCQSNIKMRIYISLIIMYLFARYFLLVWTPQHICHASKFCIWGTESYYLPYSHHASKVSSARNRSAASWRSWNLESHMFYRYDLKNAKGYELANMCFPLKTTLNNISEGIFNKIHVENNTWIDVYPIFNMKHIFSGVFLTTNAFKLHEKLNEHEEQNYFCA